MPYNFNATFTQPIILKLDNGVIKGAKDWADTITKGYITTIKAGLPQNVPPTLPAPSQQGAPYPIGASGFTTADSRQKAMYTVLYAYFYAKEISLDKGSIKGLAADVVQMVKRIKQKTKQVKTLIQTIKLISKQLLELPKILTEIIQGIKDEIEARIEDLKHIDVDLSKFKTTLSPADFADMFKEELSILQKIKSFNPLNLVGLREIALFVSEYGKRTNTILAAVNDQSLMKSYIQGKLLGVAKVFLELAKGATDPTKILNFVSQLNKDSERVKNLYKRVQQFDLFIRYLQPKLRKLEEKKKALVKQLRDVIQKKLVALRGKLSEKIAEFVKKKKDSKAASLYKKATKIINDIKTKVIKQVKKYKGKIQLLQKALKISITLVGKVTSILLGIKIEFDNIKKEILAERKKLDDISKGYSSLPSPAFTLPSVNLKDLTMDQLQKEMEKLTQYFHSLGIGEFANLGVLVMTQTKCNLQQFKQLFERKRSTVQQYVAEMQSLEDDIKQLVAILQELKDDKKRTASIKSILPPWLSTRINSIGGLLHILVTKIRPKINKVQAWIRSKIKELKMFVEGHLNKFKEDVKIYAINLLPLKSNVEDPKDKKASAEAKLKIIKEKVAKVKKLILMASYVAKMAKGSIKLIQNVSKGNYKFADNQGAVDLILDGLYSFRGYNQTNAVLASLLNEKTRVKNRFKSLIVIEALTFGLIETFKEIKETDFIKDFNEAVKGTSVTIPGAETMKSFQKLLQNPPKTPLEFKDAANLFALGTLEDAHVATKIVDLERKHLLKSREIIKTLCDIPDLDNTKFIITMNKIKNTLDKKQSFILLAFRLISDEFKKLMSFIEKKVKDFITIVKKKLQKVKDRVMEDFKKQMKNEKEKKVNVDAIVMSFAFGLAARMFWLGANWVGPTGTNHVSLTIGPFKPIKAKSTEGASKMIKEIASSFEKQLQTMQGLIIPPANTGIPPFPFSGYK
jgi:hypothetical protein